MLLLLTFLTFTLLLARLSNAQSPAWGQCGGIGWSGATTCVSGYTCAVVNPYYSQCTPGSGSTPTTTNPGGSNPPASSTATGPNPTGSQIRTVQDPVFHLYLQNSNGTAVLGPESSSGYFKIGSTITLNSSSGSSLYLNANTSSTTSYKALSFGATATTTNWGLEGDTIIITSPRQLNFIACKAGSSSLWSVFLQTGNDTPSGQTCTGIITMHLPCLC
ncbi:hypothetical protein PQX77_004566 [Marasmius sp. AFHP31]|nr:hypothetical protein PQX77_004566 [Marasmius sp. AFHP31]